MKKKFTIVGMVAVRVCDHDGCQTWEGVRVVEGSAECPEHRPAGPDTWTEEWEKVLR